MEGSERSREAWTGAILAGGRAQRFGGRDKAVLVVAGRRIIDRQLDALRAATPRILIVANDRDRYADLGVRVVSDVVEAAGPLGGIYTALVSASTSQVVVIACDMPFVVAPLLAHLAEAGRDADVAVPSLDDGVHPLCAAYSTRCVPVFDACLRARRFTVQDAFATLRVVEVGRRQLAAFGDPARLLANVNTEEDLLRLGGRRGRDD